MYKKNYGNIPNKDKIHYYLIEDNDNLGAWVSHSKLIGKTARKMAKDLYLDADIAYALGCLHDIGKKNGKKGLAHIIEGFHILRNESYFFPARIAISHCFIIKDINSFVGDINIGKSEIKTIKNLLKSYDYNDYDKLIQVLDNSILNSYIGIDEKQKYLKEKYGKIPFENERLDILKGYEKEFEERLGGSVGSYVENFEKN